MVVRRGSLFVLAGSVSVAAQDCDSVLNSLACNNANECYPCGDRINFLISDQSLQEVDARQIIADEFWDPCGPCSETYDEDIILGSEGYVLRWEDTFDADGAVNSAEWNVVNKGGGFGNQELQFYTNRAENSWVSDGTLKIKAMAESYQGNQYTSAKLETKKEWLYGKFSVRSRIPGTARGTWPAHWMMPRDSEYGIWPKSGELDIMEHLGYDPDVVHATVHTQAYNHLIGTERGSKTNTTVTDWHTYTMEWTPNITRFALDGEVYHVFRNSMDGNTDEWPFDKAFYLILNMAVGGTWGGAQGVDAAAFQTAEGQVLEVDWVRVEQLPWQIQDDGSDGSDGSDNQVSGASRLQDCLVVAALFWWSTP